MPGGLHAMSCRDSKEQTYPAAFLDLNIRQRVLGVKSTSVGAETEPEVFRERALEGMLRSQNLFLPSLRLSGHT